MNNRNIRVAKNNMKVTDLQLKRQVITTVSAVLNLYWDLVSFNEDQRIKQEALNTAQTATTRATNARWSWERCRPLKSRARPPRFPTAKENLLIAQTNVAQQETVLKNALSRNSIVSQTLDEVHILPLDHIMVPEKEDLKPTAELVNLALTQRPEIAQTKINIESSIINLGGTRNALLPNLQAFFELTNNGLSGQANPATSEHAVRRSASGFGWRLRQFAGSNLLRGIFPIIPPVFL